ncbi:MAG: hypothetical protein H6557_23360 [Lewinellaceae bacterium]|nr:hypothetical protein [Phaeodactylibacter sp.]MCB9039566.1 hypothetical protein [Lewinellaceae bacterium]
MQKNDLETRLKMLEQQVRALTAALGEELWEGQLQCTSHTTRPPSLSFVHEKKGDQPRSYGVIEAGDFGNGYEALRVSSGESARLDLISKSDVLLQADDTLHVNATDVRLEAQRVTLDGELSAPLCTTKPFSWRSGQPPVRLVHQSHGIPVLTELKGKFRNNSSGIRMYVDPEDGYWYLAGDSSKGAEIAARVICIGRV